MKQLPAAIAGVLFMSFVLVTNLYIISYTQPHVLPFTQEVVRIETKREDTNHQQFQLWAKLAQGSHGSGVYVTSDPKSVSLAYLKDCWEDTNYLRMFMDPYCTLLWMMSLDHQSVVAVSDIKQFSMTSDVGMNCKLDGVPGYFGIQGKWKTCQIHDRDGTLITSFANEIVSFHVDRLLGIYRVLPKIPRLFSKSQLHLLASQSKEFDSENRIDSILHNCGSGDYVDGSLDAALPKQFSLLPASQEYELFYFKDLSNDELEYHKLETFNIGERSKMNDKRIALEIVSLNIFATLLDYYPPISSLKIINNGEENGPIIYDNLIHSKCQIQDFGSIYDHPFAKFCKFPKRIAERLLSLRNYELFGEVVRSSTRFYQDFPSKPFLSEDCYYRLNSTTQFLIETIEYCIEENGYENVLITDLWDYDFSYIEKVTNLFSKL